MEYGVRLEKPQDLPADPRDLCPAPWKSVLPPGRWGALYFGTEFCEDRLPSPEEVVVLVICAREKGLEPVLLTPPVHPRGLKRLEHLLGKVISSGAQPTVLFNDWGVHELLRQSYPLLPRRAGRLLNRALRDPRLAADRPEEPERAERGRYIREFLAERGAVGVETDADLEAAYLGDGSEGLQRVLHLPYTSVATGRHCLLKAQRHPAEGAFTGQAAKTCHPPCSGNARPVRREDTPFPLWRAGNTLFYEVTIEIARANLRSADRVVLHARPCP